MAPPLEKPVAVSVNSRSLNLLDPCKSLLSLRVVLLCFLPPIIIASLPTHLMEIQAGVEQVRNNGWLRVNSVTLQYPQKYFKDSQQVPCSNFFLL
ncbi:hypothetical protein LENED_012704 [Lentinula edodes]|uniref:Uncharacterized protein n=1 Tax=Lentinula edodes TaxID=5353 RepID=A0A1Q3ET86_LENED|nr:hypothetical protein LENED_012704 [Lentinula edodes]